MKNNKEEKNHFAKIMWALAEDFGGKISNESLELRFTALKQFSIDEISKAGTWLLMNRVEKFPAVPTTKEIIDAVDKISGNLDTKTKAGLECDKVFKNLKFFGRECPTVFKNKTTQYLMTSRWDFYKLGMMTEDDLKWFRKDFIQAYEEIDKQDVVFLDIAEQAGMIPVSNLKGLIENKNG